MLPSAESVVVPLQTVAVPLIIVLFYFDGMVIGKLVTPSTLYIAYVAVFDPFGWSLVAFALLAAVAATLGQLTLYRGFNDESPEFLGLRRRIPYADRIPAVVRSRVSQRRLRILGRLFSRFGGVAITATNAFPWIRSILSIPAGLSQYPRRRFVLFSTVGNLVYLALLTAIAWGLVDLLTAVPWQ